MFAVVEAVGRQYRVTPGEIVKMEKVDGAKGDAVSFDKVLMVSASEGEIKLGQPYLAGATVTGTVVAQNRDKKVLVFRYKPKKRVRIKRGHRQSYSLVRIEGVQGA
jgi:large subunit ribosomal protein L21